MELQIFNKIETAQSPDFGGVLSRSFELFKKVWVDGLVHLLLNMAIALPLVMIIYIPLIGFAGFAGIFEQSGGQFPEAGFSVLMVLSFIIMFCVFMIVLILVQAITIAITAHFFLVCKQKDLGLPVDAGGYFSYLKKENFKKTFLLAASGMGIALLAALLCYLPIFYVMVPLQLMIVIFAFNQDLTSSETIKASFKLGNRFWLIAFGLIFISSMIAQVGILLCGIGLFATAFFTHIPMYYFYKDTIGFEENSGQNTIES